MSAVKPLHPESLQALQAIKEKAGANKKTVFISGNFNIVHPGHLRLLRFAAECGDFVVVGILPDGSGHTFLPENLRWEGVRSISWVNHAFILRDPPETIIRQLKPAVVIKGKEHEEQFNPELAVLSSYGGQLLFGSGDMIFSSVDLLRDEFRQIRTSPIVKPDGFARRHGFTLGDLVSALQAMQQLNVLVIGDTIMDEYVTCDPMGMSQEDPTIVVTPVLTEQFVGGAGIVAAHARQFGKTAHFFSVLGRDETAVFVRRKLDEYGVTARLYEDPSRPTTRKQRFRAAGQTLLRVNHMRSHAITREHQKKILADLLPALDRDVQLVIFSDFNYGCLPQPLVDEIIGQCRRRNIMMAADSQSSSQIGNVARFKGMTLLTPTEREARLAVQDFSSGLVVLAEKLRQTARAGNIIVTLGAEGILIHAELNDRNSWLSDRLPAMNTVPKDTAGAGDSFLVCAAMMMAAGCDIWQSAYLGSLAAAYQVGRTGNSPLHPRDLQKEIESHP